MDKQTIRNALLECREIEDVLCFENKSYQGKVYDFLVECQLVAYGECVPIRIGINDDWPINLFDFYLYYENGMADGRYCFIPHVDAEGKMCLWGLDNVLIEAQFEGLLQECVRKAVQVVEDGKSGRNKMEFLREFRAYWKELPNIGYARLVMPSTESPALLKWGNADDASKGCRLIAAQSADILTGWCKCKGPLRNAAFFNIDATNDAIFPPNPAKPDCVSLVKRLLSYVEYKARMRVLDKLKAPYIMFFHIRQPHGYWADIGFRISGHGSSVQEVLAKSSRGQNNVEPLSVKRIGKAHR